MSKMRRLVVAFVRLRWRLLRGAIRHGGAEQVGAIASAAAAAIIGVGGGIALFAIGRTDSDSADVAVIVCAVLVLATLGFGIVAGIAQPIDPRVIGAEPLDDRQRAIGLLAATAFGPPGLAGIAVAVGLAAGMLRTWVTAPIVVLAAVSWLLSLLLLARTATNLLALLLTRSPRLGQITVGIAGLVFYGAFQFVPPLIGSLSDDERHRLAGVLAWSPPGQLGRAIGSDRAAAGVVHLAAGTVWVPVLAVVFAVTSGRVTASTRRSGGSVVRNVELSPALRAIRDLCGGGPVGAIAWRSLLTRFRTPRTALETFTGAGVGLAAVLVPALSRDSVGSGAVLVGGAVQLAVLFMSGNSLGTDGPAVTHELLAGADLADMVAGKARSIAIVAAPLVIVGPLLAAAISGEWTFLAAGFGVGAGALMAGTGAAIVQSALVPIAIPETDNPFASGESGKGILSALLLVVVLSGLAIATVPVALALLWATDRGDPALVTLFGALTVLVGWLLMRLGVRIATARLGGRQPEFLAAVTPAR
jgi:ABC-2 type transport system permease protein